MGGHRQRQLRVNIGLTITAPTTWQGQHLTGINAGKHQPSARQKFVDSQYNLEQWHPQGILATLLPIARSSRPQTFRSPPLCAPRLMVLRIDTRRRVATISCDRRYGRTWKTMWALPQPGICDRDANLLTRTSRPPSKHNFLESPNLRSTKTPINF